ncbi:hypothetical protein HCR_09370 [Hydrogenimonas cancrithermarum]|uniref:VanZ-like domain-containing protein n=1 Tax=Hydrogenimonas cancrithermarum TaxID=2993563 RepID=A0ABN6WU62_9BACT|nr:hypothetical protein HCR_09370 [Hydrogenimonas cancrithermarum]
MALLYAWGYGNRYTRIAGWMLMVGIFIEAVQYFLPYREASVFDVFADIVGIMAGVTIYHISIEGKS